MLGQTKPMRTGDIIMFRTIHEKLIDAIQSGQSSKAYYLARLLAWFTKRITELNS